MRIVARILIRFVVGSVFLQALACTTTHTVRTVGKGNYGVEASLGGPVLTNLGAPIPAPNLYLGGRYGVLDDLDISAAYNLTAPIIPGMAMNLILAGHYVPIQPGLRTQKNTPEKGWSLATGLQLHSLTDFETGFIAMPAAELAVGYRYRWFNPFVGVNLALNFSRPFGEVEPVMLNPYLGFDLLLPRDHALSLRFTFFDVTHNYYGSQVEWVYLSTNEQQMKRHGILGISIGYSCDFMKVKELPESNLQSEEPVLETPPQTVAGGGDEV